MMNNPVDNSGSPFVAPKPRRQIANWIIAIALTVIATTLVLRAANPFDGVAFAQNNLVGSRGLHAFTGQLDKNTFGLFMMDVDNNTVWVYEYIPMKRCLRLVAARSFMYDRYLEDFNGDELMSPDKVREMVERARNARTRAAAVGSADPAPLNAPPNAPANAAPEPTTGATTNAPRDTASNGHDDEQGAEPRIP